MHALGAPQFGKLVINIVLRVILKMARAQVLLRC